MKAFSKFGVVPFAVGDIRTKDEIEESAVWQRLKENDIHELNSTISRVKFSPVAPYSILALSGLSGAWIDGKTRKHSFSFAKAKTPFTTCAFRNDGVLVALGREDSTVDIYPVSNHQTLLRRFKLNSGVILGVAFSPFANELVVGCGDGTLHIIDISARTDIKKFQAHSDAISAVYPLESGNIWVTSSHDCTLKVWDLNQFNENTSLSGNKTKELPEIQPLSEIKAPNPITNIVLKGSRIFAACGETVFVVDIKSKAEYVINFSAHTRPIVGLAIVRSNLVTASADRTIKIFDPSSFVLLHTMKIYNDITSFDALPDASAVAIALTGGIVHVKYASPEITETAKAEPTLTMPANFRVFNQFVPNKKLTGWNRELKQFNFPEALDLVLKENDPPLIVGMLDELDRLGKLDIAIAGRDQESLKPILKFLVENAVNPVWSHVVLKAIISVETIYRAVIRDDPLIGELFDHLITVIRDELDVQLRASRLVGKIDVILNKAE
ncbi:hypothetical protein TRFO_11841 [Tritrichomonas foetus]|uniref:U3 small nucleolar RNA-associated protein 15 C-terminal domain-containing protein n=1 Tax=Tritrichomonas foetus TaxID=1144522 RepID=A0A1J4J3U4_9EUKA|nr:hypothetical protein TRFO_11841 [Tritrichomonas foetus]|eukprot:OHS93417.1 hypothetical protein TRFO_11841 [Tritrichomonas foetus]